MTYDVLSEMLNPTLSVYQLIVV